MFFTILKFEIRYWLRNSTFYIYFFAFFLLSFLSMAGAAGVFGAGSTSGENVANAPLSIYNFVIFFNKLLFFILPAIIGNSIYKDFKTNFNFLFYTYPFSKADYLFAKFISAFLIVASIAFAIEIGLLLGTFLPSANPNQLIDFDIRPYLQTFFIYLIPNLLLISLIVFSIVLLSRNIYIGFIAIILFWLLKEITLRLFGHKIFFSNLFDPFGENITQIYSQFWSLTEQNHHLLQIEPILLINRGIWLSIAIIIFIATYRWFSFHQNALHFGLKKNKIQRLTKDNHGNIIKINLNEAKLDFSFLQQLKNIWKLAQVDFKFIIKNGAFLSIVIAGMIFVAVILLQMNPQTDTKTLPTTWMILGLPVFFFSFLIQILTFLYAGVLMHRAKAARFLDLISTTPVPNWVLLSAKFLALLKMQIVLLSIIMLVGIAVQIQQSYYHFEIGHYIFDLFFIHLIGFIIWAFAALFIQSLFETSYFALFILLLAALGISQLPSLGIESYVFRFNESPNADFFLHYSDMNGYGHSLFAYFLYKCYWLILGLVLFATTILTFERELAYAFIERYKIAKKKFKGKLVFVSILLTISFLVFGFYLFRQENKVENKVFSKEQEASLLAQFRKKYSYYAQLKQPRITSVFIKLDIFPESQSFIAEGKYTLTNKTNQTIDTLFVKMGYDEISTLSFPSIATLIEKDTILKFAIYKLDKGIAPNDSINLGFSIKNKKNTLLVQYSNILKNGTYLKSDIFPRLGYFDNHEKTKPNAHIHYANHYQSTDADVVNFEAIVSTTSKQLAITSGNLLKEWQENNRKYFHYKTDKPIKFVFGFNSGEFALKEELYKGVAVRVYYHPNHDLNISSMIEGIKASLDYNKANFGEYQHKQVNIIEFSRSEGSYATTAGNCIPVSEIRFLNDNEAVKKGGIDLSFYVVAHELSHQWWGNQVIPADALGATMITESMAEYITAKIYEKKFGKDNAMKFLAIQRNRYLSGIANETGKEVPLYLTSPEQTYISYGKGAIALYTLSGFIGEQKLNQALKKYLDKVKFQTSPYTTSLEMLNYLKKATPDSLQYLITDMFETADKEKLLLHFKAK